MLYYNQRYTKRNHKKDAWQKRGMPKFPIYFASGGSTCSPRLTSSCQLELRGVQQDGDAQTERKPSVKALGPSLLPSRLRLLESPAVKTAFKLRRWADKSGNDSLQSAPVNPWSMAQNPCPKLRQRERWEKTALAAAAAVCVSHAPGSSNSWHSIRSEEGNKSQCS